MDQGKAMVIRSRKNTQKRASNLLMDFRGVSWGRWEDPVEELGERIMAGWGDTSGVFITSERLAGDRKI